MPESKTKLPPTATLRGVGYNLLEREGTIIFTESTPVWSQGTSIRFWRADGMPLWYMSLHGDRTEIPASHIVEAYRLIVEAYGDGYGRNTI
jgi:hypothetical protein